MATKPGAAQISRPLLFARIRSKCLLVPVRVIDRDLRLAKRENNAALAELRQQMDKDRRPMLISGKQAQLRTQALNLYLCISGMMMMI